MRAVAVDDSGSVAFGAVNTPAHAVFNLVVLGRTARPSLVWPLLAGALLPDSPMFVFYLVEKARGVPEAQIWSTRYFDPSWQACFDLFNSLPLIAVGLFVAWRLGAKRWSALLASMGLHSLCDLLLHNNDAHRHLFPFSQWRFSSPVSYWDPAHHGSLATLAEILMVVLGIAVLWQRFPARSTRTALAAIGFAYGLYFAFVITVWL